MSGWDFGPFESQPPPYYLPTHRRRALLMQALRDVPLGAYDRGVVDGIAGQDTGVVRVLVGLIERAREQQRRQARTAVPRQQVVGRPVDDVTAIAMIVRQLSNDDVYSLFREAARVRPSSLTAEVFRRAEEAQRGPQT